MFTEKTFAIIDTETLGGAAQAFCPTYHCAGIATTKRGEVDRIDIVVIGNLQLDNAFYGKFKKDYYRDLLKNPDTIICYTEEEAKEIFSNWLMANDVSCACAHNSGFDFNKTFVAECIEGMEFIDTWLAFFETIGQYAKYNKFCAENGFVTANKLSFKDSMEISVSGNDDRILLISRYDNLGKGASGAAVECMNIILGCDETCGLEI
jgi:hypothetical protein